MSHTLFLASTPLHTFLSLGLMAGPFAATTRTLVLVDRKPQSSDFVADAMEAGSFPGVQVRRFPAIAAAGSSRGTLAEITELAARLQPDAIVAGNDRRLEFYAAIRGCPGARRIYVDDGLYSYVARETVLPRWLERLSDFRRSLKYGLSVERPSRVGGSRSVQEAYVLLPQQVHAGLAGKHLHALSPDWFAAGEVRDTCARALQLSGLEPERVASLRLLILLPHHRFLTPGSRIEATLAGLMRRCGDNPAAVAVKRHPASHADAATGAMLRQLGAPLEIPARLPVETLAPLLADALVVGVQTTGLLSLKLLTHRVEVKSVPLPEMRAKDRFARESLHVYESAGILPLDGASGNA